MAATPREVDGEPVDHIAVVGGIRGLGSAQDRVYLYNPSENRWHEGPSLPEPRHHTTAASLHGALYVSGGARSVTGSWEPEATVWRLAPDSDRWHAVPDMPDGRYGHRLVVAGEELVAVGGHGPGRDTFIYRTDGRDDESARHADTGEAYEAGKWRRAAPIPVMRDHLSVVVAEGEIWAIGGRADDENFARVDIYDPAADRWRDGPDLPADTSGAAEGFIDGEILIFGGEDPSFLGGQVFDRHWRIDPSADDPRWSEAEPPLQAVHGAEGAVLDGRFYIAGGAHRQGGRSVISWRDLLQIRERYGTPRAHSGRR